MSVPVDNGDIDNASAQEDDDESGESRDDDNMGVESSVLSNKRMHLVVAGAAGAAATDTRVSMTFEG